MKNIKILLGLLLLSIAAKAQFPSERAPASITVMDSRLKVHLNLSVPHYADTTTANLFKGLDSIGAIIYTDVDSLMHFRSIGTNGLKYWKVFGTGNGTGIPDTITVQGFGPGQLTDFVVNTQTIGSKNLTGPVSKSVYTTSDSGLVVDGRFGVTSGHGDDSASADRSFYLNSHHFQFLGDNQTHVLFGPVNFEMIADDATISSGVNVTSTSIGFFSQINAGGNYTEIDMSPDSITFDNLNGYYSYTGIPAAPSASYKYMVWDTVTHRMEVAGLDASGNVLPNLNQVLNNGNSSQGSDMYIEDAAFNDLFVVHNSSTTWNQTVLDVDDDAKLVTIRAKNGLDLNLSTTLGAHSILHTQNAQTTVADIYFPHTGSATDTLATLSDLRATGTGNLNSVAFFNSSGALTGSANFTYAAGVLAIFDNGIGTAGTIDLTLANSTVAAAGAQQGSPAINWEGTGWKTNSTAGPQSVDARAFILPVQGTAAPSFIWKLQGAIAGGSYSDLFEMYSSGKAQLPLYGSGTFTGTAAYALSVDASGNIIETPAGGGGGGIVTSVTGTTNRITSSGGTTPAIDISASYVGQSSITTLGTVTTGVWNGTAIANANLANSSITINGSAVSLGGSITVATLTRAAITSGTSSTVAGSNYIVTFNPASVIATYALTLPASPTDLQVVEIEAGGTITSGNPVITALTVAANSGQTLVQAVAPTTMNAGEYIKYKYRSANTSWYREN